MLEARVIPARRWWRAAGALGGGAGSLLALLLALVAGVGWLYLLRGLGWFALGPRVGDSLPLLQLAGFDGQPLARLAVAWLLAGALFGVAMVRVKPLPRALVAGALAIVLLLFASQAAFALSRNLRLIQVLWHRAPGLGPWLEGVLFAAGCALPGPVAGAERFRSLARPVGSLVDFRHLGLGARQNRDAGEHDRDRDQVHDRRHRRPS
jgi:hypothetical protein